MKVHERLLHRFGRRYPAGSVICKEGDEGRAVYFILSGRVQIERRAGGLKGALATLGAGELFGEMSALISSARTASARALEESYVAVIERKTFRALLKSSGEVSFMLLKELARRVRATSDALESANRGRDRLKTAVFLVREGPVETLSELTDKLGSSLQKSPEEAADLIDWLRAEGVIELSKEAMVHVDVDALWAAVSRL